MWQHIDQADDATTVIAMIEDPAAIDDIDAILEVDGLDGVFIGRGDVSVALNDREQGAPRVTQATDKVIAAARRVGKPVCMMPSSPAEAAAFRARGVNAFVVSSDQGFMRSAAAAALTNFRSATAAKEV
jgi:2-keto-3-deoxy-L-rhamnonate aldolase RhmA